MKAALVAVLVLLASPARGAPDETAVTLPVVETATLDNGLQIAHLRIDGAPAVTVQVWYHVGSKDEARDRRGSAHMFEHMMFKGTEHVRPEQHAVMLSRLGGTVNAFTTEDVTAYHNTVPKQYFDFALQLEAERMRNLRFREQMISAEKQVVMEEIRQQENSPLMRGFLRFLEIAYTVHPYAWTSGGDLSDLEKTTTEDLKSFYDHYYVPNNALLIVVGDVDKEAVLEASRKWFGDIDKGAAPPRPANKAAEPAQTSPRREVVGGAQVGLVIAGFHIPAAEHEDIHALQVLAVILSGGESSRLYDRLVRRDKVARQAGGQLLMREHPGLFLVFGLFLEADGADKVEAALRAELKRTRTSAPSAAELEKARNQLLSSFVFGLESVTGLANQIGTSWVHTGDPVRFLSDLEAYEKVTAADLQRVAKEYLAEDEITVVVIPPTGTGGGQ